ncbi:MAG: sigma-70 family RNA polymerase sigma factor [bacterium]|nr:sigma-70 family RNA polymerase sigma factor [bacterium]
MVDEHDREERVEAALEITENPDGAEWLGSMYERHSRTVFRAAYRVTGCVEDSEDVLHTIFLRLSRRSEALDLGDGERAYLKRAATNSALDIVRSRKRRAAAPLDEVGPIQSHSPDGAPDRVHAGRDLADRLVRALSKVGGRGAEYFSLRYFEDLDNTEIARLFDTSPGAVAVVLHRMRKKLQDELSSDLGGTQ